MLLVDHSVRYPIRFWGWTFSFAFLLLWSWPFVCSSLYFADGIVSSMTSPAVSIAVDAERRRSASAHVDRQKKFLCYSYLGHIPFFLPLPFSLTTTEFCQENVGFQIPKELPSWCSAVLRCTNLIQFQITFEMGLLKVTRKRKEVLKARVASPSVT